VHIHIAACLLKAKIAEPEETYITRGQNGNKAQPGVSTNISAHLSSDHKTKARVPLPLVKHVYNCDGVEVLTAVTIKSTVLRDVKPCNLVYVHRRFGKMYFLYLQGQRVCQRINQQAVISAYLVTLMVYQTARRHIPGDSNLRATFLRPRMALYDITHGLVTAGGAN
jgi:hypothetical protein